MKSIRETVLLTVAAVREGKDGRPTQYLFNQRQQIFVAPATKALGMRKELLAKHVKSGKPVKVVIELGPGLLHDVTEPSDAEVKSFRKRSKLLPNPAKGQQVNLKKVSSGLLNWVRRRKRRAQKSGVLSDVIPGLKRAQQIFNYCAQQCCCLPQPRQVSPCIPFQFLREGCYARAHKMRWIINTELEFKCEKVFSFANQNWDSLAAKAEKWGGCCVVWWYHVAPLVNVKVKSGGKLREQAMVIDPGMFDEPVLLSDWLAAQENTTCDEFAHVSMYSIQPGSAYIPANYEGTQFSTDPDYIETDTILTMFCDFTTC